MAKPSAKRSHADISDDDIEDDQEDNHHSGAKTGKLSLAEGTKHDTTQLWFDDISKEDLEKAYGKSGKKVEYDPTATGKHK